MKDRELGNPIKGPGEKQKPEVGEVCPVVPLQDWSQGMASDPTVTS